MLKMSLTSHAESFQPHSRETNKGTCIPEWLCILYLKKACLALGPMPWTIPHLSQVTDPLPFPHWPITLSGQMPISVPLSMVAITGMCRWAESTEVHYCTTCNYFNVALRFFFFPAAVSHHWLTLSLWSVETSSHMNLFDWIFLNCYKYTYTHKYIYIYMCVCMYLGEGHNNYPF